MLTTLTGTTMCSFFAADRTSGAFSIAQIAAKELYRSVGVKLSVDICVRKMASGTLPILTRIIPGGYSATKTPFCSRNMLRTAARSVASLDGGRTSTRRNARG